MSQLNDALILKMLGDLGMPLIIVPQSVIDRKKKKGLKDELEENIFPKVEPDSFPGISNEFIPTST